MREREGEGEADIEIYIIRYIDRYLSINTSVGVCALPVVEKEERKFSKREDVVSLARYQFTAI